MSESTTATVLFHADCLDGFGAAYAAWRQLGDTAIYRPMHHGATWNIADITGHRVFILDFSFSPEILEQMASLAVSVIQIDHHASALRAWSGRITAQAAEVVHYSHPSLPLQLSFDMNKSGARLAWEYFHPEKAIPLLIRHIEEQDMWRFSLPETRAFCRALRLLPFDFMAWHQLDVDTSDSQAPRYRQLIEQGQAIELYYQREVDNLANSALRMPAQLRGEPVDLLQARRHSLQVISDGDLAWLALPCTAINANALFASELGNALTEKGGDVGLVWYLSGNGDIKASLRSRGKGIDVSTIAARYGGGGHPNAAGFRLPAAQFLSEVLTVNEQVPTTSG